MNLIGVYVVENEIGRGGTSVVLRAVSPDRRVVAIKLLLHRSERALARFDRERRLLAAFGEAEGFVPLLDAGECPQGPYFVMPLVTGGTLRKKLERGPLGVEETLELAAKLTESLALAHARGVVHRDLKPENIIFAATGEPLIADLGIAKHLQVETGEGARSAALTRSGDLIGTASYMAPETLVDASAATPAADVFALGALLHECLTGAPAFPGATLLEILARVEGGDHTPLAALRPDAPAWLGAVIERCLAIDPAARYRDAGELGRALESRTSRRRAGSFLAAALVAGAALALGVFVVTRPPPAPPPVTPVTPVAKPPAPSPEAEARRIVATIVAARAKGVDRDSLADATRAIELAPKLALAWAGRAFARFDVTDNDGALADAEHALELDPRTALALIVRGRVRLGKRDFEGALADEDLAVSLEPKNAFALSFRGSVHHALGDDARALEDLSRAIELDGTSELLWNNRAAVRISTGDLDGAIADATHALELGAQAAEAYGNRGEAHRRKGAPGDLDAAIADLGEAIRLDPRFAWALRARATTHLARHEPEPAIADLDAAIELDPRFPAAYANRGLAHETKGDRAEAIADYERFLELAAEMTPNDPNVPRLRDRLDQLRAKAP